ncbi:MAG TPA: sigma-54 dependent transcriptional regulator [Candidatus Binataceae bacterium]|nr:sigma-54 dependent transcriptional regulator [Candidatus Binataceae bacterium]
MENLTHDKIMLSSPHEPANWIPVEALSAGAEQIGGMVVRSEQMRSIVKTLVRLGPHNQTVLIEGESGTGKELIAWALHSFGTQPDRPFVTFNCSNLVDTLAEAQLFGHVKGAFTDAREDSLGYFRSADGGTLFLDEIGELPLNLQPKLLRAVESHEIQPVGSTKIYKVAIRLVAATNRDLRAMMKAGQFREDLFYRLSSAVLLVPPLRERAVAIPCFIAHFIERYDQLFGKKVRYLSREALDALCSYAWPGNIRELAHVMETAVIMTDADRLTINDLPAHIAVRQTSALALVQPPFGDPEVDRVVMPARGKSLDWTACEDSQLLLDNVIKKALLRSLEQTQGNRRRAADLLGVSRSTLYRMLARYELCDKTDGGTDASESPAASTATMLGV